MKKQSFLKLSSNLLQQAVFFLLLIVVWQTCSDSRSEEILKEQLDKTEQNLSDAVYSLNEARSNIDSLNSKVEFFNERSKLLTLERDSLLLKFKRETAANWKSLQSIIKRQKEVNAQLIYLRNKNRKFE